MEKFLEILGKLKKYRDLIYIGLLIVFCIIFSSQCSKIDRLNHEIDRQENNRIALTEQIVNYEDELGRANAEKHAYQLTQEELRDSIGLLKQKNKEYLSYISRTAFASSGTGSYMDVCTPLMTAGTFLKP